MKILLLEDNESIAAGLVYSFKKKEYEPFPAADIRQAVRLLGQHSDIALAVIDVALPDGNGFDFYKKEIKPRNIPAIFLTARDDEDDIVKGLEIGAEDYVTKPFSTKELLARVAKILMRSKQERIVCVKNVAFNMDKQELCTDGRKIELTPLELKITGLLFSNINKVITRNILLDRIWEWTGNDVDDHTVTVYMNRIRDKIGSDIIVTVKGMGYRIDEQ